MISGTIRKAKEQKKNTPPAAASTHKAPRQANAMQRAQNATHREKKAAHQAEKKTKRTTSPLKEFMKMLEQAQQQMNPQPRRIPQSITDNDQMEPEIEAAPPLILDTLTTPLPVMAAKALGRKRGFSSQFGSAANLLSTPTPRARMPHLPINRVMLGNQTGISALRPEWRSKADLKRAIVASAIIERPYK